MEDVLAAGGVLLILLAGVMTLAKGHWGWFLVGLLLTGSLWLAVPWMPTLPGSFWERRRR